MHILLAQINPIVADLEGNTAKIIDAIKKAKALNADMVVFPELSLTGYPPEDFLLLPHFIEAVEECFQKIVAETAGIIAIVGLPRHSEGKHFNSAAICEDGKVVGYQDKSLLPTYNVFDERRYFDPAQEIKTWTLKGKKIAITVCEDIWKHSDLVENAFYEFDPIEEFKKFKPDLLINLSASPFRLGKLDQRIKVTSKAAKTLQCPLVFCNQVGGNDSLIFDGNSLFVSSEGAVLQAAKAFETDFLLVDSENTTQQKIVPMSSEEELYRALVLGVRDYFRKSGFKKACLGLSGGIDSAVVACIAAEALGHENVLVVSMPSRYSSEHSVTDADLLAKNLDLKIEHISIEEPFSAFLDLLNPLFKGKAEDATEENLQARARGMIMMAISNKFGHIVLSTGNKSELAIGYATLYGDMCGGLAVIGDVTKRQVYALARWINRDREIIPENTITKAPSAELRFDQKDSDSLPDYEVLDNIITGYVESHWSPKKISERFGYAPELVNDIVRRIHRNEYKRRQSAPVLCVSSKALLVGRFFPIVQRWV